VFNATVQIKQGAAAAMRAVLGELRDASNMGGAVGRQLVEHVGRVDADQNRATFAAEAAPGGAPWAPLNPDYAKRKRRKVGGRKKLVWDGKMRASATAAKGANRIARVAGDHLELGTNHRLAKLHQFGKRGVEYVRPHHRRGRNVTKRGLGVVKTGGRHQVRGHSRRVNLPARPFIGKGPGQAAAIKQAITRVLHERLVRASGGRLNASRLGAAHAAGRLIVVERS
jgi:phage gpG-like protein